jgi:hypothetical protein
MKTWAGTARMAILTAEFFIPVIEFLVSHTILIAKSLFANAFRCH